MAGKYGSRLNSSFVDISLLNGILIELDGLLVPDEVMDETIDPMLITSMGRLVGYLKKRFDGLSWDVDIALKYDMDTNPSNVLLEVKGPNQKIRFLAGLISQYLIKKSLVQAPLKVKAIVDFNESINVEFERSNKIEAEKSLYDFFGKNDQILKIIKKQPAFWKAVINRHILSNYNMVTIHRNYFEDMLAGNVPLAEITIENLAKKPVQEIPLNELLSLIKEVYETSKIADRVEIDKDTITLFHCFNFKGKSL